MASISLSEKTLIQYWTGSISYEDIQGWDRPPETEEAFRELMAERQAELGHTIFVKIVERAKEGDVSAADWLERRGFITLPDNSRSPDDTSKPGVRSVPLKWT